MSQLAPVIVIFGITGDLSKRKLLPALYHLLSQDLLPADTKIVGTSRRPLSTKDLLSTVELCVLEKDNVCDPVGLKKVNDSLSTAQLDPENPEDYSKLKNLLDSFDEQGRHTRLFYMSVPAGAYGPIIKQLSEAGLNDTDAHLLLEKPFGYDTDSARSLARVVHAAFKEEQVYRIDHYLAKETAQNLLEFRLHNPVFATQWNSSHIKRVRVIAFETLDIEGRADFYEQTGALRDIIQSHLMQLLGITLMDLPEDMSSAAIHASKRRFFEQLRPANPSHAVRGQYEGYREEVGNHASQTETYARLHLRSNDPIWKNTDIVLETGKAMDRKVTEITLEFEVPGKDERNNLTFHIQPNEGISLDLQANEPGANSHLHKAVMDLQYQNTYSEREHIDAYERVLLDAIKGDPSLFASDSDVAESWRILQPVLDEWQASGKDMATYPKGSTGPQIKP